MHVAALRRFDFSAARQLGGRWRGDNFTAWVGVGSDEFPDQLVGGLFRRFNHADLNSILGIGTPLTAELARSAWDALKMRLTPPWRLVVLDLAEEDGDAVSVTGPQTWSVARTGFSAAHRTHAPALSDMENAALYGRCDNPAGHGHNYRVEAWCPVSPTASGELAAGLRHVVEEFDHKNLSIDIPDLRGRNVVTEAVAALIARRIPIADRVRVWETPDFFAEFRRGAAEYGLGRRYNFHAVHPAGEGIAGYNYGLQVRIKSPLDPRTEAAFDLGLLDGIAAGILSGLDHSVLPRDVPYFRDHPVRLPDLARYLWSRFEAELGQRLDGLRLQDRPRRRSRIERDEP